MQSVENSILERVACLARLATEKKAVIATAESCTAGGIAFTLTSIAGSSAWFDRGFVTYSNESKVALLGVSEKTLAAHGAVSAETAQEMVAGALSHSPATAVVAVTGIAGPGGALPDKPVGTVYLAGADARTNRGWLLRLTLGGYHDRGIIRTRATLYALDLLRRMALGLPVPDGMAVTPDDPADTLAI